MQYEDIVYKAGILAMAVRLEEFLVKEWERRTGRSFPKGFPNNNASGEGCPTKRALVYEFVNERFPLPKKGKKTDRRNKTAGQKRKRMVGGMKDLFDLRDDIAHPSESVICEDDFWRIRSKCLEVDADLEKLNPRPDTPLPRMGEVMVSCSLRYDMGNAGDIIKHGILAEFAEWWASQEDYGELRFADPFGGRPWETAKKDVREQRVWPFRNSGCALWRAQEADNRMADGGWEKYYGSSHVVLNAAGKPARVFASDYDKLTRGDLRAAGKIRELRGDASSLKLIEDEVDGYNPRDGYSILTQTERFDLILIDPFADFLHDELAALVCGSDEDGRFHKIKEAIGRNDDLWIAVFVLMSEDQTRIYDEWREKCFNGCFIALRCSRFVGNNVPAGESGYDMEILLVSSRLAEKSPHINELREKIANFKLAAERVLGKKNILAWGLGDKDA